MLYGAKPFCNDYKGRCWRLENMSSFCFTNRLINRSLILLTLLLVYVNEILIYYINQRSWKQIPCQNDNCTRVMLIADPQLLGLRYDQSFYGGLARYDADRYLRKTFAHAVTFSNPDIICFLGDLLDEGNIASPWEFQNYVKRFHRIYHTDKTIQRVHIAGDNDIGGENGEYISNVNVHRFEDAFTQADVFDYKDNNSLRFFKINRMMLDFTNPDKETNSNRLRIGLSHAPILIGGGSLLRAIINELDPHVIFSGHWHDSRIFIHPSTKMINFYDTDIKYFNLKAIKYQEHNYLEIMVPTASYRMGKNKMGIGFAVIGGRKQNNFKILYKKFYIMADATDIVYPAGCKPLKENLGTDELMRRLKTLANALQSMGQDDALFQQYVPLALYLADDYFLQHPSRDVQLLIACCIADVLRVYAPEAPYKDEHKVKQIFLFFIKQLYGLKDPKDPSFKRYFYLLENLAYVKSFNMCFDLEDSQEIFRQLFSMMFKIINEDHSIKVKNFIVDILSPLISEADNFTSELLDILLINIVEPRKSQNKNAYQLAQQLIVKTEDSLEPIIKMFFNQVLVMDRMEIKYDICHKIYDLIYELNVIAPSVLCSVLPQLECKLKSTNEEERLRAVSLLSRMFSEKNSQLSKKHKLLLRILLGRFCDISVAIRVKCVQSSMHYLINQPHMRNDIMECLRARQHDSDENVRYEVVMAIVETAKREFNVVCESMDLLHIVRERTLDKKFKIRKEAISGLAFIYRQAICENNDLREEVKSSLYWIKNKVMHGYYMPTLEDRLTVERLLITCLVPYKLGSEDRMKKLYHLLGTFDDNATKAFIELHKNQIKTRKTVHDWVKLHHTKEMTPKLQNQLNIKQSVICKLLSDPLKAAEFLTKFSVNMRKDPQLLKCMETILKRDVSCKECADTMSLLIKKLGNPIMTNLYYQTVKMLIERIASVMVDKESISVLIGLIDDCIQGGSTTKEVGIPVEEAGEKGLKLLSVLSYIFSAHFFTEKTLGHMTALLSHDYDYVSPFILKSFTHLGRYLPLSEAHPLILNDLAPVCKDFALEGTVKQAKHAVRCIFINAQKSNYTEGNIDVPIVVHPIFNEIIDNLRYTLTPNCEYQRTKIVTLGHIAYNMPQTFTIAVKNMIARRIVKDLLIQGVPEVRNCIVPMNEWCDREILPNDTLCKLEALKTVARWLLGLRNDEHAAQKTFRMLTAFIAQRGDLLEQNHLYPAEKSWLRLTAACAMLKICEQKGVGDQYTVEQYYSLSQLMRDPVPEVREIFARKLHKGLGKGLPNKCLPLDFMGYYVLAGLETDKRLADQIRLFVEADVNRRREYLKTLNNTNLDNSGDSQLLLRVLPDFVLAFAIPVLVHDSSFTDYQDGVQLKYVEKCLRFILEPLMAKPDVFSFSFYKDLIDMMKDHYLASTEPSINSSLNRKMWAACDLANYIIFSKMGQFDLTSKRMFSVPIQLPEMYFTQPPPNAEGFPNTKIYIPYDTYSLISTTGATSKRTLNINALKSTGNGNDHTDHLGKTCGSKRLADDHFSSKHHSSLVQECRSAHDGDNLNPDPKRARLNSLCAEDA